MSEEKKPKQDKAPEAEKPAPKPHVSKQAHPHNKKIGKMDLAELNEAIELCKKQQGGLWSRYGQSLVTRKAAFTVLSPMSFKKAA